MGSFSAVASESLKVSGEATPPNHAMLTAVHTQTDDLLRRLSPV